MKYSHSDAIDGICTFAQYYEQFETETPNLGGIYLMHPGDWMESTIEIVFVDDKIAVGREIASKIKDTGYNYYMFHARGVMAGWRYQDTRPQFRLRTKT